MYHTKVNNNLQFTHIKSLYYTYNLIFFICTVLCIRIYTHTQNIFFKIIFSLDDMCSNMEKFTTHTFIKYFLKPKNILKFFNFW